MKKKWFVIAGVLFVLYLIVLAYNDGNIAVGKDAVIIPGECVVINYDASPETWDKAKAAWLKALETYPAK